MSIDWSTIVRQCGHCEQPGTYVGEYWLWLCDEHMTRFRERQATNRRFKAKHPYRSAVTQARIRARRIGAEGDFTEDQWLSLIARYKYRCLRCKNKVMLTIDHIVPLSKGGSNDIANIQPLCRACNLYKMTRTKDYR